MQCVILAGGLASRMWPITESIPKSLIQVGPYPFIHYQLEWLQRHGVTEVILSVGFKGEMIEEYVGDGSRWNLRIRYVREGTELRGTGGALRLASDLGVLDDSFLVTYGDSYLPIDFSDVWQAFIAGDKPALMTVYKNSGKWDTSNVWFEENQITLYDKFKRHEASLDRLLYIDYGLSALRKDLINKWISKEGKNDLAELFYTLSRAGSLKGFEVKTRFYEIGSPAGLEDFRRYILEGGLFSPPSPEIPILPPIPKPLDQ